MAKLLAKLSRTTGDRRGRVITEMAVHENRVNTNNMNTANLVHTSPFSIYYFNAIIGLRVHTGIRRVYKNTTDI